MSDVSSVINWWITISFLGIIFLPLTSRFFSKFVDKGYIFSKVLGILLASYTVWLMGSLKLFPFTRITIILTLLFWSLISLWLLKNSLKKKAKIPWKWIILEESLFIACLSFWSYIRATEPSIRGLEKFMDFGFVNSILRTSFFPPADMWLTKSPDYQGGYFINYYYFGHYITAFLTKLSSLNSAITYNLMMATLFAFTFTLPFSIGANLFYFFVKEKRLIQTDKKIYLKSALVGFLAAFLVSLGGNLHTIYTLTSGYPNEAPQPFWQLELGFHPERYWYPNATRFIPFTIHEFPIYSFVVADLHGHVSDIPFVFLTLAILLKLIVDKNNDQQKQTRPKNASLLEKYLYQFKSHTSLSFFEIALLGLNLGVMYMTNAWDGFIYMVLSGLVILSINLFFERNRKQYTLLNSIYTTFSASLFLLFFFLLSSLPFSMNFRLFVSGVGVLCAPAFLIGKQIGPLLFEKDKCQKSPIWMLSVLWGFFYYNVFGFLVFGVLQKTPIENIIQLFVLKITKKTKVYSQKINKFKNNIAKDLSTVDVFVLICIFISTLLLVFPEFFYMKDIYPAHYRANTMFKLGYQAFMMLSLSSAYIFFRLKTTNSYKRLNLKFVIYNSVYIILFALVAIYPYFAITSYYGGLKTYRGLYGLSWMKRDFPNDYEAIKWIRQNINCPPNSLKCNNQPVIAEATGDSYTDYARVSANTGLPTIIGWPVHEWLWRGSYDEAGKRIPEVEIIYESTDIDETKEKLKKYNVEYVFIGTLEREKYKNLYEEKFSQLGKIVFQSQDTKIYKINLSSLL